MKKLLAGLCLLILNSAQGQIIFEDDFSEGLDAWELVSADGDSYNWSARQWSVSDGQGMTAISYSFSFILGPIYADNWMIAGPFDLSTVSGTVLLDWVVQARSQDYPLEDYSAYGGTISDIADLMASPYVFSETMTATGGEFVDRELDISGLAGESEVYIAFRHHSTNQLAISIDDVVLRQAFTTDLVVREMTVPAIVQNGPIEITGKVKNYGTTTINSFNLNWNDGDDHSALITETIDPGDSYDFVHPIELNGIAETHYAIEICALLDGDENPLNDCLIDSFRVAYEVPEKHVVTEFKSGANCSYCPYGMSVLDDLSAEENSIEIEIHKADPMQLATYVVAYEAQIPDYIYPRTSANRVQYGNPFYTEITYHDHMKRIPPARVNVEAEDRGDSLVVNVIAWFAIPLTGDYRLALVVTEDGVTGTGSEYDQANYFSGSPYDYGGYESLPNPVPAELMVYDHVARALGNDEMNGSPGSLPGSMEASTYYSYTYTIAKDPEWNLNNLNFIGMLVRMYEGKGFIENAGITSNLSLDEIAENEIDFGLSVFPNPSTEVTNVNVFLQEAADVQIEIFNAIGERVHYENTADLEQGNYLYRIDVSSFPNGIYLVRGTIGENTKVVKLIVQ